MVGLLRCCEPVVFQHQLNTCKSLIWPNASQMFRTRSASGDRQIQLRLDKSGGYTIRRRVVVPLVHLPDIAGDVGPELEGSVADADYSISGMSGYDDIGTRM